MGCFCAAAVIYATTNPRLTSSKAARGFARTGIPDTATAGVFCTYPQPFLTKTGQVFSEIISSTVLVFVISR